MSGISGKPMKMISKIICGLCFCILFLDEANAQRKSIGASFSYAGVGLVYEHRMDGKSFAEFQLRSETSAIYAYAAKLPGLTASFVWNMVFAETELRDGNTVSFFAGPGVTAGFTEDIKRSKGLMFGLRGRIGGECTYRRNVTVSFSISPVLGLHLDRRNEAFSMVVYKTGLAYAVMPEVGIKYAF